MGKEMTARNEGCLRGLNRGESEREGERERGETNQAPEDIPLGWRIGCCFLVFTHLLSVFFLSACNR